MSDDADLFRPVAVDDDIVERARAILEFLEHHPTHGFVGDARPFMRGLILNDVERRAFKAALRELMVALDHHEYCPLPNDDSSIYDRDEFKVARKQARALLAEDAP